MPYLGLERGDTMASVLSTPDLQFEPMEAKEGSDLSFTRECSKLAFSRGSSLMDFLNGEVVPPDVEKWCDEAKQMVEDKNSRNLWTPAPEKLRIDTDKMANTQGQNNMQMSMGQKNMQNAQGQDNMQMSNVQNIQSGQNMQMSNGQNTQGQSMQMSMGQNNMQNVEGQNEKNRPDTPVVKPVIVPVSNKQQVTQRNEINARMNLQTTSNGNQISNKQANAVKDSELQATVPESNPSMPENASGKIASRKQNCSELDHASSSGRILSNLPTPDMSEFQNLAVIQGNPELQILSGEEMAVVLDILTGILDCISFVLIS